MELNFRNLRADEIECRATILANKIEISLHSKAHTCTRILNETVGSMGWEKEYTNGNKNCIVRIWDGDKNRFVSKEDCGGSLTEVDGLKGQASNGFKRVCALGWGLGIELYSQPDIFLPKTDENVTYDGRGNATVSEQYAVKEIEYDDEKHITHCVIVNSRGTIVYDGPNENGESNVTGYDTDDDEVLIIPEDADEQNDEYADENDDCESEYEKGLPDNTDGFEDENELNDSEEDCVTQPTPFGNLNYRKEIEAEIKRTHVKQADVLSVLKVDSFEELKTVPEETLEATLEKLRAMPTYKK